MQDAGLAVLGLDGPGQGEALLLDGILWSEDFPDAVSAALDVLAGNPAVDTTQVGLFGISIGGMWALRVAAADPRVRALYDLGGPINTKAFARVPFIIKTRMCQVTGARDAEAIAEVLASNSTESDAVLSRVACAVRIMHGGRDRVVAVAEKQWLRDRLVAVRPCAGGEPRGHSRRRPLLHRPCRRDPSRPDGVLLAPLDRVNRDRRDAAAPCRLVWLGFDVPTTDSQQCW